MPVAVPYPYAGAVPIPGSVTPTLPTTATNIPRAPRSFPGTSPLPGVSPVAPVSPASGGVVSRMLGLGRSALAHPMAQGVAVVSPFVVDAAEHSMPGQMLGAMSPDGGLSDAIMGASQPDYMAPYQMQGAAMPEQVAPQLSSYPETAGTRYPAPVQAPYPETAGMRYPAPVQHAQAPARAATPAYAPTGGIWEGQNRNIQDDTRARAMAWLALQGSL